jgi:hypothetical protein
MIVTILEATPAGGIEFSYSGGRYGPQMIETYVFEKKHFIVRR